MRISDFHKFLHGSLTCSANVLRMKMCIRMKIKDKLCIIFSDSDIFCACIYKVHWTSLQYILMTFLLYTFSLYLIISHQKQFKETSDDRHINNFLISLISLTHQWHVLLRFSGTHPVLFLYETTVVSCVYWLVSLSPSSLRYQTSIFFWSRYSHLLLVGFLVHHLNRKYGPLDPKSPLEHSFWIEGFPVNEI